MQNIIGRLSIIVSVYNCDALVKRCIDSIIVSLGGQLPEFIIVDNARSETTRDLINKYAHFGIQYYPMPKDMGFAGANNIGFQHSTKEFVVLVNSDTVFHDNPFPSLLSFMDSHPKAMVAQGTVCFENDTPDENGKLDTCGGGITTSGRITNPANKKDPSNPEFSSPRKIFYAYGALFLFRREAVMLSGGFLFKDEFYAYYEEADFCHRIWLSGHEVWYVPTPIVGHAHTATFKKQHDMNKLNILCLSNRRLSFLSCYELHTLLKLFTLSELLLILNAFGGFLLHGNLEALKSYFLCHFRSIRLLPVTLRRRKTIQHIRKVSDKDLQKLLFESATFKDLIKEARGMI